MAANAPTKALPGSTFRVPGVGAREKRVKEKAGLFNQSTILNQGSAVNANTSTFQRLDIVRSYLLEVVPDVTFTAGSSETLTPSQFGYGAFVGNISVQMESLYKTFNQPGWMALAMQAYRPATNSPESPTLSSGDTQSGTSITSNGVPMWIEVPVSMYFDIYYELTKTGEPVGVVPQAIVSPQYMAATTRNVTPDITFNQLLGIGGASPNSPMVKATSDTSSTASGSATWSFWRDGWYATKSLTSMPPTYRWQYTRSMVQYPTNGAAEVYLPLDVDVQGQGQILSVIALTYDPEANSGVGSIVDSSAYEEVSLLYGSDLLIYQDSWESNHENWIRKHGADLSSLNFGSSPFFGWDLALQNDGRLTNVYALNTLVTAGVQVRINYTTAPSSSARVYVGIEALKAVSANG